MDPRAQAIIDFVKTDRDHGANQLAREMLQRLEEWVQELDSTFLTEMDEVAQVLMTCRPSMAPIGNCATRWHERLQSLSPSLDVKTAIIQELQEVVEDLVSVNQKIAQHCREILPESPRLMTHSYSSAISTLFEYLVLEGVPFSAVLTTSYPGLEGNKLAVQMEKLEVETVIVPDTQIGMFINECDLLVIGCDTLIPAEGFINKCGSYLMALAAKDQGKPLWVLADTFKHRNCKLKDVPLEEMDISEIHAPVGDHLDTRNVYFEPVPKKLMTGWIDENGVHR
ncbi:hypothetical protein BTA51_12735 [Hahella sp. CCB-MM4]|uniref:translation initiation factor eIF-2B n=1 Tax=Hahella sp. (strain CCB-MM4) TaxID=1926491 RepID=UPI000BDDDDD5|nr:hypothetical protein [Hahella sp. CCB-MM4]OZG72838.1 hypothetical protein BTA51_12735 [Hahella sp. CCB-MM4]